MPDERDTVRGLVQPQHEQMAVDELRLFVSLGERPAETDVCSGGRPAVFTTRLRRRRRLQTLGHTVEQTFQVHAQCEIIIYIYIYVSYTCNIIIRRNIRRSGGRSKRRL